MTILPPSQVPIPPLRLPWPHPPLPSPQSPPRQFVILAPLGLFYTGFVEASAHPRAQTRSPAARARVLSVRGRG
jgi:hypothetical protein